MLEARRVRFGLLLGATYALLLVVLGYRVYEDASIPWAVWRSASQRN